MYVGVNDDVYQRVQQPAQDLLHQYDGHMANIYSSLTIHGSSSSHLY